MLNITSAKATVQRPLPVPPSGTESPNRTQSGIVLTNKKPTQQQAQQPTGKLVASAGKGIKPTQHVNLKNSTGKAPSTQIKSKAPTIQASQAGSFVPQNKINPLLPAVSKPNAQTTHALLKPQVAASEVADSSVCEPGLSYSDVMRKLHEHHVFISEFE